MARAHNSKQIASELTVFLAEHCPGMTVDVGMSNRWKRRCLTFTWPGFKDLLPEERYRLVLRHIPPEFVEKHCTGAVWLELTPGESVDDYLKLPRSEDVDSKLPQIWKQLREWRFFELLEDELVRVPPSQAPDDFSHSKHVLDARGATAQQRQDACLAFMRQQAYNDWEVLRKVRPVAEK